MTLLLLIPGLLVLSTTLGIIGAILNYERGPGEAWRIIKWRFFTREGWRR